MTLKFNQPFSSELNDETSEIHKNFSRKATDALRQIIETTTATVTNYSSVSWVFTEGSIISTAKNIPVIGVTDDKEFQNQISAFNSSDILDLQSVAAYGEYLQYLFVENYYLQVFCSL